MNDDKKPVILFSQIEAGLGHIVTTKAIYDALKANYDDVLDIQAKYVLRDSGNKTLIEYERYLMDNVKKYSQIHGFGDLQIRSMFILGPQNTLKIVAHTAFARQVKALVAEYVKLAPDVIVSTHFFTHYCAVRYKLQHNPDVKVLCYCPDNNVHGWWDIRGDMIYTNNEYATAQAYQLGFTSGKVKQAFYPTRSEVAESNGTKQFYRDQFGIPQDKFAVVVADNVYQQKRAVKVCRRLMETDLPITICLLAGKDEKARQQFEELKSHTKPNVTLLPFGFVGNAPQLYAACDLFVTKAGPNAVLDSVMMDTPVVIDYCATPIERKTRDLFIKHHRCGYYITSPVKIKRQVEEIIRNPELLRQFDESLKYFDKNKNGSVAIADDIAKFVLNNDLQQKELFAQEDKIIDDYYRLNYPADCEKRAAKLKRKLHGGKACKQYAKILDKLNAK